MPGRCTKKCPPGATTQLDYKREAAQTPAAGTRWHEDAAAVAVIAIMVVSSNRRWNVGMSRCGVDVGRRHFLAEEAADIR
ncbi:hypothetical protein ILUMI_12332 [Ignelater luminosus]|uniref:Uncharacterized protein n=1 Tax=Ignelater luminosus TaxID=2038154 RepID=A0A8K0CYD4_IGNLU|nr:hypothetical protein ILUMI_12332 [Ignelater luminosus]